MVGEGSDLRLGHLELVDGELAGWVIFPILSCSEESRVIAEAPARCVRTPHDSNPVNR
jgi:hypothetical protein